MFRSCPCGNAHLGVLDSTPVSEYGHGFAGVGELGKLNFALAYAGDAEYMRLPDNRKALGGRATNAAPRCGEWPEETTLS